MIMNCSLKAYRNKQTAVAYPKEVTRNCCIGTKKVIKLLSQNRRFIIRDP
jgi:hypothetical protein